MEWDGKFERGVSWRTVEKLKRTAYTFIISILVWLVELLMPRCCIAMPNFRLYLPQNIFVLF